MQLKDNKISISISLAAKLMNMTTISGTEDVLKIQSAEGRDFAKKKVRCTGIAKDIPGVEKICRLQT
jgi:hypothetical protein